MSPRNGGDLGTRVTWTGLGVHPKAALYICWTFLEGALSLLVAPACTFYWLSTLKKALYLSHGKSPSWTELTIWTSLSAYSGESNGLPSLSLWSSSSTVRDKS